MLTMHHIPSDIADSVKILAFDIYRSEIVGFVN